MYGLHNNRYTIRYCLDDIFYNKERYFHSYIIYVLHRFWGNIVVVCVKPFPSIVIVPPPPPPFLVLFSGQEFPRTAWLYAQGLSIGFSWLQRTWSFVKISPNISKTLNQILSYLKLYKQIFETNFCEVYEIKLGCFGWTLVVSLVTHAVTWTVDTSLDVSLSSTFLSKILHKRALTQ